MNKETRILVVGLLYLAICSLGVSIKIIKITQNKEITILGFLMLVVMLVGCINAIRMIHKVI